MPAAKWFWQSDNEFKKLLSDWSQPGWVAYDEATSAKIEEAFQQKKKKIPVDTERFVDFVEMLQRRADDESKRRAVKREVVVAPAPPKTTFTNEIFYLCTPSAKKKEKLILEISKNGGLVADHLLPLDANQMNKVTHVVCAAADISQFQNELNSCNIPIVTPEFIFDSLMEEEVQPVGKYKILIPPSGSNNNSNTNNSTNNSNNSNATNNSNQNVPAVSNLAALNGAKGVKLTPYPFELSIEDVNADDTFTGMIHWPSLSGTKTKVRGKIKGADITFEEYDYLTGDAVQLNSVYHAQITSSGLVGTLTDDLNEEGRFILDMQHSQQ